MDKVKHLHRCARDHPSSTRPMVDGDFGGVLAGPELSRRDREMATAAVIAALGAAGPQLRPHTLVLAGELVASCTLEIMAAIAERIPGALYEELPGTPHMQTLERPELVAEALDRFPPTSMPDRMEHR